MAKMSLNRKSQLILGLAMKINNTPTKQEVTGDKPTVFVWFSGHVNELQVWIYSKGWFANATSDYYWVIDLSKDTNEEMDECIARLKDIWHKYKPTQVQEVSANAV